MLEVAGLRVERLEVPSARDQDRTSASVDGSRVRVALADGAGGMTHGDVAAELAVTRAVGGPLTMGDWASLDLAVARSGGETTLVALEVGLCADGLFDVRGASAGDSSAWARRGGVWIELTCGQGRKRLGSGRVAPHVIELEGIERLLVWSDGALVRAREYELLAEPDLHARLRRDVQAGDDDIAAIVLAPAATAKRPPEDERAVVLLEAADD